MLLPRSFLYFWVTALLAGCTTPAADVAEKKIQVTYTIKADEKTLDLPGSPAWQPAWSDSLIARLERGVIPAYDSDNQRLPADSLPRSRRIHGLVLQAGKNGEVRDDGVIMLPPRDVIGVLDTAAIPPAVTLYFYDQSVELEHFYARVHHTDLEKLVGARLEFIPAK